MSIIGMLYGIPRLLWNTFTDALFPAGDADIFLLNTDPQQACLLLPKSVTPPIQSSGSIFAYKDKRVTKMVWNIKYKKSKECTAIGGLAIYHYIQEHFAAGSVILPMPITERRRRERGYNQCELLMDEIESLDTNKIFKIDKSLLIRTHHDSRQTLKNRQERLESAKGIFSINQSASAKFPDKNIQLIIIDDVITTGSTMKEAEETLRSAGFVNVHGLSLAH
jgi:ComF family protein